MTCHNLAKNIYNNRINFALIGRQ